MKYCNWEIRVKEKRNSRFVYTDTYAAIKQTLLRITIFKDTFCLPQELSLSIIKRCPQCAKKYSTQRWWTVNNFVIVRMADALTAFNAVKLPRYIRTLDKRENPNFRTRLKTDDEISCLGFRTWYKSCHTRLRNLQSSTQDLRKVYWAVIICSIYSGESTLSSALQRLWCVFSVKAGQKLQGRKLVVTDNMKNKLE